MEWINHKINLKCVSWVIRILGVMSVLLLIFIAPLLTNDQVHAMDSWRKWLAYPYSSIIHQGSPGGTSTGGVMAFLSSSSFYQLPNVSYCGFGGPGGCFSPLVGYNADGKEIWGRTQASFQMNGQYACAQFNPNYNSFGIELYIDGISSGYQRYSGTAGEQYRCTVTRSPGYHTVTIRWAGGYLQNGWVYGSGDVTVPVTAASHGVGSGTSATVTSTAMDNSGLINHHWCRVNGGAWKDTRAATCSIHVDIATHGSSISFQHYAQDYVGNTSAVKTYAFTLDNTPPVMSTAVEQNGMPDEIWNNLSNIPSYTWTATDDLSGVRGFYIYFGPDPNGTVATIYETTGFVAGSAWTPGAVSDGQYYLRVMAEDWAGNQTAWVTMHQYWVDSTLPVLSAAIEQNGMPDGAWSNISANPTYTWDAADNSSGVRGFYIYFGADPNGTNTTLDTTIGYPAGSPWTSGTISNGQYYLRVSAEDWAGNQTSWATLHEYWYDGTPPDVSDHLLTPESTGWFTSQTELTVSGSDNIGIQSLEIDIGDGNGWILSDQVMLPDGEWTVQYRASDLAGNVSASSIVIKVDTIKPVSQFSSQLEGKTIRATGILTLSGLSSDNLSGLQLIQMSLDGGTTWFELSLQGAWEYQWDTTKAADGLHHVMVRAKDVAGNQGNTAHTTMLVKNAKPVIDLESFYIWEAGDLQIQPGASDMVDAALLTGASAPKLTEVQITVGDDQHRWGDLVLYESQDGSYPKQLTWDRVFVYDSRGDPVVFAPSDSYPVTVWAKNSYGRENTHTAEILIPIAPPVAPTPPPAPNLYPPEVNLTPYWKLWENGALSISPGSGEIERVTITIYDLLNRWDPLVMEFGGTDWPPLISWDGHRRFGDGILAPSGQYHVWVEVYASDEQIGGASGVIDIPAPDPPPMSAASAPEPDMPVEKIAAKPLPSFQFPWRALRPLMAGLLLGLAAVFDRRPKELRFLSKRTWSYHEFRQEVLSNANRKSKRVDRTLP
jgi:hypothetical protein